MLARVKTSALSGLDSFAVTVEAQVRDGKSSFIIIGLGDSAVKEASGRVQAALQSAGFYVPKRTLVNLAPAEVKKEGSSFDLPIAVALLLASRQLSCADLQSSALFGELSLDGSVKGVRGIVALVLQAREGGATEVLVPTANYREASVVPGIDVVAVANLFDVVRYLVRGEVADTPAPLPLQQKRKEGALIDVIGQQRAKRALQIAAVGGHNVLMVGPPGCGKSMLAASFSELLPTLSTQESYEAIKIHSIAGLTLEGVLKGERPFRSPHHSVSEAGLVGGGSSPRPGEISLAHHGTLFLDEFPEFRRSVIEALRAPLENQQVLISRAKACFTFPVDFQLIAAMNPCPCGRFGVAGAHCVCGTQEVARYLKKISQPILDRIDIHVELDAVPIESFHEKHTKPQLAFEPATVQQLRQTLYQKKGTLNARLTNAEVKRECRLADSAQKLLQSLAKQNFLSARAYFRVLRVARTIADIAEQERITGEHLAEAVGFRVLDRMQRQVNHTG